jgi:hypothetical protein
MVLRVEMGGQVGVVGVVGVVGWVLGWVPC